MNYQSTNEISQKIMILWGGAFIFPVLYLYRGVQEKRTPTEIMIFRELSFLPGECTFNYA